jgi:hypothetical protein
MRIVICIVTCLKYRDRYRDKNSVSLQSYYNVVFNDISVHMLTLSAVDHGFKNRSGQTKEMKLIFVASPRH